MKCMKCERNFPEDDLFSNEDGMICRDCANALAKEIRAVPVFINCRDFCNVKACPFLDRRQCPVLTLHMVSAFMKKREEMARAYYDKEQVEERVSHINLS